MNSLRSHFCSVLCGIALFVTLTLVIGYCRGFLMSTVPPAVVTTEALEGCTPIKDLGKGWYLVEIKQRYICENPLPVGDETIYIIVPHLVRLHISEIERLDKGSP